MAYEQSKVGWGDSPEQAADPVTWMVPQPAPGLAVLEEQAEQGEQQSWALEYNLQRGLCQNQIKLDSENKSNHCSKSTVKCHLGTKVQHEAAEQSQAKQLGQL